MVGRGVLWVGGVKEWCGGRGTDREHVTWMRTGSTSADGASAGEGPWGALGGKVEVDTGGCGAGAETVGLRVGGGCRGGDGNATSGVGWVVGGGDGVGVGVGAEEGEFAGKTVYLDGLDFTPF